ncbi:TrmH family RNA methyltransferase [Saprospira sp. CCB-QB6]|uniref:TrmH family RNA methyltransferase n=1 Tax=Saprospira sp. CCB-QB6 TaxID=3023936 RepID=UPI0023492CAB|nr:TrmH family RNA methyltransferase [Saprospira sp. CCB-QB6]WCL80564.1 TrmH family RNA methyltransferase [Saprospira sp. CCB-QB6]
MELKKKSMLELGRPSIEAYKQQPKMPLLLILDNLRSALNVGAAFRTADAFGIEGIYLTGISAQPPQREIMKSALGADRAVDWQYFEENKAAIAAAKAKGYKVYAVEQTFGSHSLEQFIWTAQEGIALIFGNEVKGVDAELLPLVDGAIEIPQFGSKHSLNVSVSMGVLLWEMRRQYLGR